VEQGQREAAKNPDPSAVVWGRAVMPKILIVTGDAAESLEVMYPYQQLTEEVPASVLVLDDPRCS
jgi:hypothetical protein